MICAIYDPSILSSDLVLRNSDGSELESQVYVINNTFISFMIPHVLRDFQGKLVSCNFAEFSSILLPIMVLCKLPIVQRE